MSAGVVFLLTLLFALPNALYAHDSAYQGVELKEGMSQGDFAYWLIQAIQPQLQNLPSGQHAGITPSVNFLLNPAAGAEEAIKFLTDQLALVPEEGWQKDEVLTKKALASLLGDSEEGDGLTYDELVDRALDLVESRFQEISKKTGVFRILSATPSLPAV